MGRRRTWRCFGYQGGLLAGVGLALAGGVHPAVEAAPVCLLEGMCTYSKPMILFVIDYSTAMNQTFSPGKTRWQAAVEAVQTLVVAQNGYLQGSADLGVMRFGHDPNPGSPGTKIPGDTSQPPLIDGHALDVPLYDANAPGKDYFECNGEAIEAALTSLAPPMDGAPQGIGAWTRGAFVRTEEYLDQAYADHPQDVGKRLAALVVLTQGAWTDPSGALVMEPPAEDPAPAAAELFNGKQIPTYVLEFGDAMGKTAANALALAGGGGEAIAGDKPSLLQDALQLLIEDAKAQIMPPICVPKMPRIMVLIDASSARLNVAGGTVAGAMGETAWDQTREALAGSEAIFEGILDGWQTIENMTYIGAAVFGDDSPAPGEQEVIVDYGTCTQKALRWALDPKTSCVAPGCTDPWGGPPIAWTIQKDPDTLECPGYVTKATSHMPRCDAGGPFPAACSGSGAQLHLGLARVQEHLTAYRATCMDIDAPDPCDAQTPFFNILVTDGNDASTDAQVQAPLEQMFAQGVTTYVLAIGESLDPVRLQNLAGWGSGGNQAFFAEAKALQDALIARFEAFVFDPCCSFHGCNGIVECVDSFCGDGALQPGEQCDDGNDLEGDGCEPTCTLTPPICGDGALDVGEACDDGNGLPGDGCEPDCTITPDPGDSSGTAGSSGDPGSASSSGGASTSGDAGTTAPAPTTSATSTSGAEESTGAASTGTASTGAASPGDMMPVDLGCGCAANDDGSPGLLAGLLGLGLIRRPRRRERPGYG